MFDSIRIILCFSPQKQNCCGNTNIYISIHVARCYAKCFEATVLAQAPGARLIPYPHFRLGLRAFPSLSNSRHCPALLGLGPWLPMKWRNDKLATKRHREPCRLPGTRISDSCHRLPILRSPEPRLLQSFVSPTMEIILQINSPLKIPRQET